MNTPSLFNTLTRYAALAAALEENGGELPPELEAAFSLSQAEIQTKGADLLALRTQCLTELTGIEAEIDRLTRLVKHHAKIKATIEERFDELVRAVGPLAIGTHKLSLRKSERTVVETEAALLPEHLVRITPERREADKTAIKAAIKQGENVPGCALEEHYTLVIK